MTSVGASLAVEVLRLNPGDIARGAKELVALERDSLAAWPAATEGEREHVRTVVRAALLRLLATDHWMPGAVRFGQGRLDVRLTIELDATAEAVLAEARAQLAEETARARVRLVALVAELERSGG